MSSRKYSDNKIEPRKYRDNRFLEMERACIYIHGINFGDFFLYLMAERVLLGILNLPFELPRYVEVLQ